MEEQTAEAGSEHFDLHVLRMFHRKEHFHDVHCPAFLEGHGSIDYFPIDLAVVLVEFWDRRSSPEVSSS